jgi:hypothetical protein
MATCSARRRSLACLRDGIRRYLGVTLCYKLNWTRQWNTGIERGTAWANAVLRMMRSKMGIQLSFARQVYRAVCLPRMLYAADLWAAPPRRRQPRVAHVPRDRPPSGIVAKMASFQRRALQSIAGVMRTTATSVLESHLPSTRPTRHRPTDASGSSRTAGRQSDHTHEPHLRPNSTRSTILREPRPTRDSRCRSTAPRVYTSLQHPHLTGPQRRCRRRCHPHRDRGRHLLLGRLRRR